MMMIQAIIPTFTIFAKVLDRFGPWPLAGRGRKKGTIFDVMAQICQKYGSFGFLDVLGAY